MKKLMFLLCAGSLMAACNSNADKVATTTAQTVDSSAAVGVSYITDSSSQVSFVGSKPTGEHSGTFGLTEGALLVNNNAVSGGKFIININSLNITDIKDDPKSKADLEGHLKSADFFDAGKWPVAQFEITSVESYVADSSSKIKDANHLVKGNLTLKDSTKNIAFPAKLIVEGNKVSATANFNIDRSLWGINYKGPNNPQDWVISKTVNIQIALSATKK